MTIEQIIEREMTLRTERFWGRDYEDFAPILANKRHGDGNRLMWFTPMSTRPNFYLVRVDSSLPGDGDDESDDLLRDFIELSLIPALEDEFGACEDEDDPDGWPAVDLDSGYSWGFYDDNGDTLQY